MERCFYIGISMEIEENRYYSFYQVMVGGIVVGVNDDWTHSKLGDHTLIYKIRV